MRTAVLDAASDMQQLVDNGTFDCTGESVSIALRGVGNACQSRRIRGMRILAFDTSGTWCSVALLEDATVVQREEAVGNAHSERLLPMINALLDDAGAALHSVDVIAFGAGPGSFTGVRIAASVAQGLALGLDRRAIAVCSLEAIAEQAYDQHGSERVIACADARMQEIYVAGYERAVGNWREVMPPVVLKPGALQAPFGQGWIG